jgi:hypothetical protein
MQGRVGDDAALLKALQVSQIIEICPPAQYNFFCFDFIFYLNPI